MDPTQRRAAWRRGPPWLAVLPLIALAAAALLAANAAQTFALALRVKAPAAILTDTHLRNILLLGALSTLQVAGALLLARRLIPAHLLVGAARLREAVRRGDERAAPVVPNQPTPLDGGWLPLETSNPLGPFAPPEDGQAEEETLYAEALLIVGALATLTALYVTVYVGWSGWAHAAIAGLAALGLALLLAGAWVAARVRRLGAAFSVTILPNGLSWRDPQHRQPQDILWTQFCGFAALGYRYGAKGKQHRVYLLDAGDQSLAWRLPADADPDAVEQSGTLCQVIHARAGLPLRDITLGVAALATSDRAKRALILGMDDAATGDGAPEWTTRRRVDGALALALLPLLVALVADVSSLTLRWLM
jgi:hypothetical protein